MRRERDVAGRSFSDSGLADQPISAGERKSLRLRVAGSLGRCRVFSETTRMRSKRLSVRPSLSTALTSSPSRFSERCDGSRPCTGTGCSLRADPHRRGRHSKAIFLRHMSGRIPRLLYRTR